MLKLKYGRMLLIAGLAVTSSLAKVTNADERLDQIRHLSNNGEDVWIINFPNVRQKMTAYPQIVFREGDTITVRAGGCVQTGGWGRTWKHYVSPQGDKSKLLYHGLIHIPGAMGQFERLHDVIDRPLAIPMKADIAERLQLWLGYEDDNYGDNGYRDHDDGTNDQCKGVGPAWVKITARHSASRSAESTMQTAHKNGFALANRYYVFPGGGEMNMNKPIGPFCCTGETATVQSVFGVPLGYIHFYDVEDAINVSNTRSAATKIKVNVSGASDLASPENSQVKKTIVFVAGRSARGDTISVLAGNLRFTVTLTDMRIDRTSGIRFDLQSVRIKVSVEPINL